MSRNNRTLIPEAKEVLNRMKFEIADQIGVNLKEGYNGDIPSKLTGRIGGQMVKKMIEQAKGTR